MSKHPFRVAIETGASNQDLSKLFAPDAVIHAPVDGEIQKKHVNTGAYVEAPTPVFMLVDNRRLELESNVPSAELGAVRASCSAA